MPTRRRISEETRTAIAARYATGESTVVIARAFDTHPSCVTRVAVDAGLPRRQPDRVRLSDEQSEAVVKLYEGGDSVESIAREMNVAPATVTRTVHRLRGRVRRVGRPWNDSELCHQTLVPGKPRIMLRYGRRAPCRCIKCRHCGARRWFPTSTLRRLLKSPTFTGVCTQCTAERARARRAECLKDEPKTLRRTLRDGYIVLTRHGIGAADIDLFDALRGATAFVLEHRFVMSKVLGRPLHPYESVDHQDGGKTNNDPKNLRIYLRGKQQPGSCPGYGTYYDEWQRAEARVRELESLLAG